MTVSILPSGVRAAQPGYLVGSLVVSKPGGLASMLNDNRGLPEIWTETVGGATNDKVYTISLLDEDGATVTTVSYTADSSATTTEIAAGLASAWNANAQAYAYATASAASNVATFTGRTNGRVFTVSDSDAQLTAANTQNASDGESISFGLGLIGYFQSARDGKTTLLADLPDNILSAQVGTITLVYAANKVFACSIKWRDAEYEFREAADTDSATTADALAATINAGMPANSVAAVGNGDGTITLTSEIAGEPFECDVWIPTPDPGSATIAFADDTDGVATDVAQVFGGIALRDTNVEQTTLGSSVTAYPSGYVMTVCQRGQVAVTDPGEDVDSGGRVYLGTGSSNAGLFFASAAADRALLPKSILWVRRLSSDGVGILSTDLVNS